MKNNNKVILSMFLSILLLSTAAMATGPRVTQGMLTAAENEMFAVDSTPFISLDVKDEGLSAEIVKSALQAVDINSTLTVLPVAKMVKYYLHEEQALAVYEKHISLSDADKKSLIHVPIFHTKENYFYSKRHHESGLNWKGSLNDLSGQIYGAHRGEDVSVYEKAGVEVIFARHDTLIKKLVAGEIDFVHMPTLTIDWMLEHDETVVKEHFTAMKAEPKLVAQYIVFNKNNSDAEKMAEKLKQGLLMIMDNGQYAEIVKKYLHNDEDIADRIKALSKIIQP